MNHQILYPLRVDPIYQYRLWGGRSLADFMAVPLPGEGPIGEAWVLQGSGQIEYGGQYTPLEEEKYGYYRHPSDGARSGQPIP
jgi:mannose-6-phosphate isomerase class I